MRLVHYTPGMTTFDCLGISGATAQQHVDAFTFFASFFIQHPVDRIIEIGTAAGGLALFFREQNPKAIIDTFDIVERPLHAKLREVGIATHLKDVFEPAHTAELHDMIRAPGRLLLLCDGGNKVREFNEFAGSLKPDDVIMAHDYCADRSNYFPKMQRIWPWWEISWPEIATTMRAVPLSQFMPESEDVALFAARR